MNADTFSLALFGKNLHGVSHVVAACGEGIDVSIRSNVESCLTNKFADDARWLPTMGGETKSKSFALVKFVAMRLLLQLIWDEKKLLMCGFSKLLCSPSGVACSRKIEYHVGKGTKKKQI